MIHFSFPDEKARRAIWKGIFPQETPLGEDVDLDYLARQFSITGGSIKNIALVAAFMACLLYTSKTAASFTRASLSRAPARERVPFMTRWVLRCTPGSLWTMGSTI